MYENVSKLVKMHRKPMSGTNKHGKHSIMCNRKGKGTHRATQHPEMPLKWLHPNKALWVSNVTTEGQAHGGRQTWQGLELQRLTQAQSIEISKHRHANRNDPNPLIWALVYKR